MCDVGDAVETVARTAMIVLAVYMVLVGID
jgi:hypothetical protein